MEEDFLEVEIPKDMEDQILKCSHCGFCRVLCPTFEFTKNESYNTRGRVMIAKALFSGEIEPTNSILQRIYSCSLCKICDLTCPAKVDLNKILKYFRVVLSEKGLGPLEEQKQLTNTILENGNAYAKPIEYSSSPIFHEISDLTKEDSDTLFYMGCMQSNYYPEIAKLEVKLLSKFEDFNMLKKSDHCCAGYVNLLGMPKEFEDMKSENEKLFESVGIKRIITACPTCYSTFKDNYSGFETIHSLEIFKDAIDNKRFEINNRLNATVTYHDPCHIGRYANIYDAPRIILENLPGIRFIELDRSKERSRCCGGVIRLPFFEFRDKMSEATLQEAIDIGAEYLVTACPQCFYNFSTIAVGYDIKVIDINELLGYYTGIVESIPLYALD